MSASASRPPSSSARALASLANWIAFLRAVILGPRMVAVDPLVSSAVAATIAWSNRLIAVSSICGVVSGVPYWMEPSGCALLNGTPEQ